MYSFVDVLLRHKWKILAFVFVLHVTCEVSGQGGIPCLYLGAIYPDGHIWQENVCATCNCTNSTTTCTTISCEIPKCRNPIFPEGECCPICPTTPPPPPAVIITDLEIHVKPDAQIIEGLVKSKNKVAFDLVATYDDTSTPITGKSLWRLNAWGSKSKNAKGKKQSLVRQAFDEPHSDTPLTLGSPLMFDNVMTAIDMTTLLCKQVTHICVELTKDPKASPDFEYSADPTTATTTCAELPCAGVIVTGNNVAVPSDTVLKENSPNNPISLDMTFDSLPSGSTIFGEDLWDVSLYGNTEPDGTGDTIPIDDQVLTDTQRDIPFAAGTTLPFTPISANVDLTGKKCTEIPYICGTLTKGKKPSRDFTLTGEPDERVFTACSPVPCEPECPDPRQKIPGHIGVPEESFYTDDVVDFTCDIGYELVGSQSLVCNADGTWSGDLPECEKIECPDPRQRIPGHIAVAEKTFTPGDLIRFECDDGYVLDGAEVLACNDDGTWSGDIPTCNERKKLRVTDAEVAPAPGAKILEDTEDNPIEFDAVFPTDPDGDDATSGDNLWNIDTWLSPDPDGDGPRISENSRVLTPDQRDKYVTAGDDLDFPKVKSNFDTRGLGCSDTKYVCAELSEDPRSTGDFDLEGVPNDKALRACTELDCEEAAQPPPEITDTNVDLTSDNMITEDEPTNPMEFDVSVTTDPNGGDATGDDLWKATVFTSSTPDGKRDKDIIDEQILTSPQSSEDIPAGDTATFRRLKANVDMYGKECSDVGYICVEISKGDYAYPDYELRGSESVRTDCVKLKCESGRPGPKGEPGEDGSGDPVYPPDSYGTPGVPGSPGARGPPGGDGRQGIPGSRGDSGNDGRNGYPGPPGNPGPPGDSTGFDSGSPDKGPAGFAQYPQYAMQMAPGTPGPPGRPGGSGPRGLQGFAGPPGEPGEGGPPGPSGPRGSPGMTGNPGDDGDRGSDGQSGSPGPVGPGGPRGLPGIPGLPGPKGHAGWAGKDGKKKKVPTATLR